MPWIQAILGAASDSQKQGEQRKQRAIDARFSPWVDPSKLAQVPDNGALQGAIAGYTSGQGQQQKGENSEAWRNWMNKNNAGPQGNTYPVMGGSNVGPYASGSGYANSLNSFGPVSNGQQYGSMVSGWGK